MKKLFALLFVCISLMASTKNVIAQGTSVTLNYAGDSSWNVNCSLPDTISFFFYGTAQGYTLADSIHINVNFGDGATLSYYVLLNQGPTFYGNISHIYTMPGAYAVQFIATGPDGNADTLVDPSVLVSSSCADISGRLYLDSNADCIYNAGDTPVEAWVAVSYNGSQVAGALSNALGVYFISVPSGFTYTVAPYNSQLTITCPASGNYNVSTLPSTGNDFALECETQFDYTCSVGGQGFRVNGISWLWLNAWNQVISCSAPNATITLTLDPMLSYSSSAITPVSVTSTQVVFNAGQLTGYNFGSMITGIQLLTNPAAAIGDTLCITLTVDPQAGDLDITDNVYTICMPVRNSCDPNEKHESHAGVGSATVLPGTRLDYTIMFQNVGNDVAYDVSILDVLDAGLDLSTLSITGFSHEPSIYLVGNTLKFEFNNINLAAASVNEPLSHGFVTYSVNHIAGVPNGTAISNSADIYFDFNAPIVTNTVTNIIDQSLGINENNSSSVGIYPNPATDHILITGLTGSGVLSIYDITGRMISREVITNNRHLDIRNYESGIYLITLETGGEKSIGRLIVE